MVPAASQGKKQHRLRVNFPLAVALDDAALIQQAYELTGESRNAFCIAASVARAREVIAAHEAKERAA